MPIRFRCVYCDKLLGIARRKAGTVVSCPHCAEKLIVPTPDPADAVSEPEQDDVRGSTEEKAMAGTVRPLFEHSDFEALLQQKPVIGTGGEPVLGPPKREVTWTESVPGPPPRYPPAPLPAPVQTALPTVPQLSEAPRGFYVSPMKATFLALLFVALLALAFGAGWMVRRSVKNVGINDAERDACNVVCKMWR